MKVVNEGKFRQVVNVIDNSFLLFFSRRSGLSLERSTNNLPRTHSQFLEDVLADERNFAISLCNRQRVSPAHYQVRRKYLALLERPNGYSATSSRISIPGMENS